ncbi:hypothetical protein [Pararhizobium sp. PWRC1-1]|uniref:hypothetical protein n=1 Tax=Pararhizobium sp. PWRC1-1 TaxID=2804566 RepID=UPI003CEB48AA
MPYLVRAVILSRKTLARRAPTAGFYAWEINRSMLNKRRLGNGMFNFAVAVLAGDRYFGGSTIILPSPDAAVFRHAMHTNVGWSDYSSLLT